MSTGSVSVSVRIQYMCRTHNGFLGATALLQAVVQRLQACPSHLGHLLSSSPPSRLANQAVSSCQGSAQFLSVELHCLRCPVMVSHKMRAVRDQKHDKPEMSKERHGKERKGKERRACALPCCPIRTPKVTRNPHHCRKQPARLEASGGSPRIAKCTSLAGC